jgi:hypothetical protein
MVKICRSSSDLIFRTVHLVLFTVITSSKNGQDQWEADERRCWFESRMGIGRLRILDHNREVF